LSNQESDSDAGQPVRERWLPQTSIRFFVALIGISALVMYIFRAALMDDVLWAKCASLVIMTAIGCFFSYALLFLITLPFASAAATIAEVPLPSAAPGADGQGLIDQADIDFSQQDRDAFGTDPSAMDRSQDSTENS
jgi:hypothetical protein